MPSHPHTPSAAPGLTPGSARPCTICGHRAADHKEDTIEDAPADLPEEVAGWAFARILDASDLLPEDHPARAHLQRALEEVCPHEAVDYKSGPPAPSGRCDVYAVCEDCGAELGAVGAADSV